MSEFLVHGCKLLLEFHKVPYLGLSSLKWSLLFLNGLLLFNLRSIVYKFADDNTLYYCRENTENIIKNLQSDLKIVLKRFRNKKWWQILENFSTCYLVNTKHKPLKIEIEGFQLESAASVNLFGITIDHNLTFDTHVSNICKTASAKVKSLGRIRTALDEKQEKLMYNSFILSQFSYCSIIWMFWSKTSYRNIKQIQKKFTNSLRWTSHVPGRATNSWSRH